MMTAYDCALEAWLNEAERVTSLYTAELAEYRKSNPPPHLADFMTGVF
jgi:hypothetical protein